MYKQRRKRKFVLFGLLLSLMIISVGYAAFQTRLDINGSAQITSVWDVEVTGITTKTVIGDAENAVNPTYDKLSANMEANFYSPGDSIVYEITVSNLGTIDAILDSIKVNMPEQDVLIFKIDGLSSREELKADRSKTFTFTITYNENLVTQPAETSITAEVYLNYIQNGNSSNFSSADSASSGSLSINSLDFDTSENSITTTINSTGASKFYYSIDNDKWYETINNEYTIYNLKPYTEYTVYVKAEDALGEVVFYNDTVRTKDETNPIVKITKGDNVEGNNGWYKGLDLNVDMSDNDRIESSKYCISSSQCTPTTDLELTDGSAVMTLPNSASNQVLCVLGRDRKGNVTSVCSDEYKVDAEAPTLSNMSVVSNDDTIEVTFTANDSHSGPYKYYFSKDSGETYVEVSEDGTNSPNYTFTALEDGDYLITAYVEDEAGNISETEAKSTTVRRTSFCGTRITDLSQCVIATEAQNEDVDAAKLAIESKGTPSFTVTSPSQTYSESHATNTSSVDQTTYFNVASAYTFNPSTGYYALTSSSTKDPETVSFNDGNDYYTCGSTSTSCTTMYKVTNVTTTTNNSTGAKTYKLTKYDYTSAVSGYDTSTSGLYAADDYDGKKTYYYRGAVSGNYVRFAGKMWRIIRVNGDGTLRIIYDGTTAHDNGESSGDRQVGTSAFNSWWSDNGYVGYMHGNPSDNVITEATYYFTYTGLNANSKFYFASKYTFDPANNAFKLNPDSETIVNETITQYKNNHNSSNLYTCFSTDVNGTCQRLHKVRAYVSATSMSVYPVEFSSTSVADAHGNIQNSTMKNYLENTWYPANLAAYTSKLSSSSVFCNNRQISNYGNSTYTNQGYGIYPTMYGYTRFWAYAGSSILPTLECPQTTDRFSVDSGLQSKPVGLITADEVAMAGGKTGTKNTLYYLYTGSNYWTMSPSYFSNWAAALEMSVASSGELTSYNVSNGYGVRPVINLDSSNLTFTGTGTKSDPYVVS